MVMSKLGKLEEEALKRKERLKNLKRKFDTTEKSEQNDKNNAEAEKIPKPMFRNYKPEAEESSTNIIDQAVKSLPEVPEIDDQLEKMKSPLEINDIDISNLAPRKIDWDLKRDIAKKLEKLERRTQRAIVELIRDRLTSKDDIAQAVNVGAELINKHGSREDDEV